MSLHSLPSTKLWSTNERVLKEDSTSEHNADLTLFSEKQQLNAEEVSTLVNDNIQELKNVNYTSGSQPESISLGLQDEEQNHQKQEQKCIQESHSSAANKSDIKDISNENQSRKEEMRFSGDTANFLESVYDLLECPVCLNHMAPPIILCESGHSICNKCRPFMTKCPLCRKSFLQIRNIALEVAARKLSLKRVQEDSHKGCRGLIEQDQELSIDQMSYKCPLTLYTHCYWQGNYTEIKRHMEEMHAFRILTDTTNTTWQMKLVVRDFKIIFALGEIFFYKQWLDTLYSKFYIQVFYVGQHENHIKFVYHLEIRSERGQQRVAIHNTTLPINDLEHTYTYTSSQCIVLDYLTIRSLSKYGDIKCTLSLERHLRE